MRLRLLPLACALLAAPVLAFARPASAPAAPQAASRPAAPILPVVQLGVDVPPFYVAGKRYGLPPKVAVDPLYDAPLSTMQRPAIEAVRDAIAAKPDLVKPDTLIVLAMRLYDVGLRDDAAFWYYAGRDRYLTMDAVLDMRSLKLVQSAQVTEAFIVAAGPAMDGYAYCSLAHQVEIEDHAIAWVAAHPYKMLGYADLPAQDEDRNAALVAAVNQLRDNQRQKKALLDDPATVAGITAARQASHAHEHYCW